MKPIDQKIYLASKSPRRRELLRQMGVGFELLTLRSEAPRGPDVSENINDGESPETYVARVAHEKAVFAWQLVLLRKLPLHPVLAADTTVTIDGKILGKPANTAEAVAMLLALSGRTHQVLTALAIQHHALSLQVTQVSEVTFDTLSDASIAAYCATQEPYDKAGGYGIQGIASLYIKQIKGSHSGIMGLPIFETAQLLKQAGIKLP